MEARACFVYWLHKPDDTDIFTQGYVGISTDPKRRLKSHKYTAKTKTSNHKLYNAMRVNDNFTMQIILKADIDYCLDIESKLRPFKNIGLNAAPGGRQTMIGRLNYAYSSDTEVREKISKGLRGSAS